MKKENTLIVTTVPVVFEDSETDAAYDKIDNFLRNNLDDNDYAEFSAALETVFASDDAEIKRLRAENERLTNTLNGIKRGDTFVHY